MSTPRLIVLCEVTVFALCLALAIPACTRTVYVVKNPDGHMVEVDPDRLAQNERPLVVVQNPDDTENPDGVDPYSAERGTTVVEIDPERDQLPEDMVIVDVIPSNNFVLSGDESPLYLQVVLRAKSVETGSRAPLNLSLVIDRSGSMAGDKMEAVKKASAWLVENLQDQDRVAVVSYASDVRVDAVGMLEGQGRARLLRAIDALGHGGGTYLSGGLDAGYQQAMAGFDAEFLNRVILLSDGNANEGVTDPRALRDIASRINEEGVTITTMGVGLDYNELLMEEVATAGGGNYHFIEDSMAMTAIFEQETALLGATVARDAVVELDLPEKVSVLDVYGFDYEVDGRRLTIKLNAVSSGQQRRALVALGIPRRHKGELVVARGAVRYRNEVLGRQMEDPVAPVAITYTSDDTVVAKAANHAVVEKVERVRNAQVRQQVYEELEKGNRDKAQQLVAKRKSEAQRANAVVQSGALNDDIAELDALEGSVQAMPAAEEEQRAYRRSKKYKSSKKKDRKKARSMMLD